MANIWDLKSPHSPQQRAERGVVCDAVWPLLWPGVFVVEDNIVSKNSGVGYFSYLPTTAGGSGSWGTVTKHTSHLAVLYCA